MAVQSCAAIAAGFVAQGVVDEIGFPAPSVSIGVAWYLEVLATFFLACTPRHLDPARPGPAG